MVFPTGRANTANNKKKIATMSVFNCTSNTVVRKTVISRAMLPILLLLSIDLAFSFSVSTKTQFRSFDVYTEQHAGSKQTALLLVHGFGCSSVYWRETIQHFQRDGYEVHTVDLLGQGQSQKPGRADGIHYSIDLWAEQIDEYARKYIDPSKQIVLMGNSLGSLVAMSAACGDFLSTNSNNDKNNHFLHERVKGIGCFNAGIGMNSRNIAKEPQWNDTQRFLINRVYDLLSLLIFGNLPLLTFVLNNIVTKELLRDALLNLYFCADDPASRVDDVLVDSFYQPAQEEGAVEALSQIYCNEAGKTPIELHDSYAVLNEIPIHFVWGNQDVVTPVEGGLGTYYYNRAKVANSNISMDVIPSGHIPFDEVPEIANGAMKQWLDKIHAS